MDTIRTAPFAVVSVIPVFLSILFTVFSAYCGNGICETTDHGENCVNCPQDCQRPCGIHTFYEYPFHAHILLQVCAGMEHVVAKHVVRALKIAAFAVSNSLLNLFYFCLILMMFSAEDMWWNARMQWSRFLQGRYLCLYFAMVWAAV